MIGREVKKDFRMKLTKAALRLALAPLAAAPVQAQDGGGASISTGAGYSSQRGALVFLALDGSDILGSGIDLHFAYELGEDDELAELRLRKTWDLGQTQFGGNSFFAVTLGGEKSDLESQQFALEQVHQRDDIDDRVREPDCRSDLLVDRSDDGVQLLLERIPTRTLRVPRPDPPSRIVLFAVNFSSPSRIEQ